jgi:serine/threonine protein kinase
MAMATTMLCPACAAPREAGQAVCGTCGRVFDPAALGAAPAPAPTSGDHFVVGQSLSGGRYRILRPLSRGGMGALYLATDQEAFGRTVVVKTLLTSLDAMSPGDAQDALRRFIHEARTLAGLRYPTIPQIYSYFQDGPLACMVMEYIDGADLSHALSRGGISATGKPYPLADVLQWAVAICRTLEYLAGTQPPVVHQDIKPANLIRDANSSQLYLVDFGAARAIATATAGPGTTIFGTPGYAAPEQYRGECGPPSDVYALAATLYHLATDDDPADHPFAFPQMGRLGYFGRVLKGALSDDPAQRPSAAILRQSIEALLSRDADRAITAPDGAVIQGQIELARWCEQNWDQARAWLYADMPAMIERELVQIDLAAKLRGCVSRHPKDQNAGLDTAIARLDPKDFGASEPLLQMWPDKLDLGRIASEVPISSLVRVHNAGRRYVRAEIATPRWLSAGSSTALATRATQAARGKVDPQPLAIDLQPGQEFALSLTPIYEPYTATSSYQRGDIVLRANKKIIARMLVSGSISPSGQTPSNVSQLVFVVFIVAFALLMLCAILTALR